MQRSFTFFILTCTSVCAWSQQDTARKIPIEKPGFTMTIGLNSMRPLGQAPGFTLGIGNEYYIHDKISVRPQLYYSFFSQELRTDRYVQSYALEIPLHVIVRPFKCKVSPFASLGGSCKISLPNFYSSLFAEGALGIERNFGYGAFGTEIRYSVGKNAQVFYWVMNFKF